MDLSAEKRKMPRMQVDLSACIFLGIAKNRSEVNIKDMSIHGISFRAEKYFARGTRFDLILLNQRKESGVNNLRVEVVRCKTLNGFSSDGHFEVGAKFLFKARRVMKSKENPGTETLVPHNLRDSKNPVLNSYNKRLKNFPAPGDSIGTPGSPALGIRMMEVNAQLIQSVRTATREETVVTRIQIKQARLISSPSASTPRLNTSGKYLTEMENNSPLANLARLNFSGKRLL